MDQHRDSISSLNIQILQKNKPAGNRYKSIFQMISFGVTLSQSAMMFGFGLTEISAINIDVLISSYNIPLGPSGAQALLVGLMPFGGILGAALFSLVLQNMSRKVSVVFSALIMIISVALVEIKTVQTLCIGRYISGVSLGIYVSIAPIYIRQIVPKQLRPQILSLFSLLKILGIVTAYSLQNILEAAGFQQSFRILLAFNGIIGLLQAIFVFFFMPHSPVQMVQKRNFQEAKKIITQLYNQDYVQQILEEMKTDYEAEKAKTKPANDMSSLVAAAVSYTKNRKNALIMAIHMSTFRQFIGANVLVIYSGQIVGAFPNMQKASNYTPLVINYLQLATNVISLFTLSRMVGKRPNFLVGCVGLTLLNFAIAISLLLEAETSILVMMGLYMLLYGGTFLPVSWSYPSEIIPAEQAVYANTLQWVATCIILTISPIVVGAMPDNNAYPLFFFFGAYGVFGTIYAFLAMVESRGRTYEEIVKEY